MRTGVLSSRVAFRIGTPAVTSRGMKEEQMKIIGDYIATVIKDINNTRRIESIAREVRDLAGRYSLYPD